MNQKKVIVLILCFSMLFSGQLCSQVEQGADPLHIIGARFHRSVNIQHTRKLKDEIKQSDPWCIEADINWHLRKKNIWDYCYCYPRTGIAFRYTNFVLPDLLGSALAVYPFVEPYIRPEKRLSFALRFGIGPAYVTKVYDAVSNPDNLFISSHINYLSVLSLSGNYALRERVNLRLAANFNHISNAGYSRPNLGVNFPSINAGLDYSFDKPEFIQRVKDPGIALADKKNRFDLIASFSVKPVNAGQGFPVYGMSLNYSRAAGRLFALNGGVEWIDVISIREKIKRDNIVDEDGKLPDHNQVGALAGIEWHFGRFIFYQQAGFYLYAPYREEGSWYQRYGWTFRLTDHLFTGINIRAYGQDADFMDVRIGFSL
jgi:hypothetical protein